MSGAWMFLTALLTLATVIVQSVTMIVVTLLSLVITIVAAFAADRGGVPATASNTAKTANPSGKAPAGSASRARPARPKPSGPRKPRRCDARCRKSTQPVSKCECSCGGKSHGSEASGKVKPARSAAAKPVASSAPPTPTGSGLTRSQLRSKGLRREERDAVRAQRRASA